jgi:hypothetical protein
MWVRCGAVLNHTSTAWPGQLLTWLERFEDRFGRPSQRGALPPYVTGLMSDSSRKSMESMRARLSDPETYQGASEQLRSNAAQTRPKTRHHQGPEDEARHYDSRPCAVCKTSIPGSNPGGASNITPSPAAAYQFVHFRLRRALIHSVPKFLR